jgi:hypothetical protein
MNQHGETTETMFSMRLVLEPYKYEWNTLINATRMGTGSNTSTVTLRVVGGDEKGSVWSETVKYGHECQGTRTRGLRLWGPTAYTKVRPVLSSERAPPKTRPWGSTPRLTDWLTVNRNVTLTLLINARYTANSVPLLSVWRYAIGKLWVIEIK